MPIDTALNSAGRVAARNPAHRFARAVDARVAAPEDRQRRDGFAGDRRRVHPADDRCPALGLVAKDWAKEVGINYAPPSWITLGAADAPSPPPCRRRRGADRAGGSHAGQRVQFHRRRSARRRDQRTEGRQEAGARPAGDDNKVVDPLADVMKDIRSDQAGAKARARRGGAPRDAAVRRRQVGPRHHRQDDQGLGDVDLRRPGRRRSSPCSSARCWARSPATTAAGSTTC